MCGRGLSVVRRGPPPMVQLAGSVANLRRCACSFSPKQLYSKRLPISAEKYRDLIKLCDDGNIPEPFQAEYRSLPHSARQEDILPESDFDDPEEEE
ncbi:hypothetical protein FJT64_006780 [Amphibalanus amphitrite]|uniref:Uncharacterized protein n=1 Tax=Amphibalanus amphitrite TaxID=1232801 RepID=A0A6A4VXX3_AMPAM|nr:hypothetical protein FJT64_006780 [Amphibalanus amphitrite]